MWVESSLKPGDIVTIAGHNLIEPIGPQERVLRALQALIAATEKADNPGDYGVGSDDPVMAEARAAIQNAQHLYVKS